MEEVFAAVTAADETALVSGFHEMGLLSDGRPYRWTGPQTSFEIIADIDRSAPSIARLIVFASISPHNLDNIFCTRDGETILAKRAAGEGWPVIEVDLPARFRSGSTKLVYHLQECCRPPDYPSEHRELGLGFVAIEFVREADAERLDPEPAPIVEEPAKEPFRSWNIIFRGR